MTHLHWPEVTVRGGLNYPVRNIFAIGRNYAQHAKELGNAVPTEPVVFLKAASSLRPLQSGVTASEHPLHFEAEIVVALGAAVPKGTFQKSLTRDIIAGLALGLDLTRREWQEKLKSKGLPWTMAKSFQGAALVSEVIPLRDLPDFAELGFAFDLNGRTVQQGKLSDMIFDIPTILAYVNQHNDFFPGDLIFTGTPEGVAAIKAGDAFQLRFAPSEITFKGKI